MKNLPKNFDFGDSDYQGKCIVVRFCLIQIVLCVSCFIMLLFEHARGALQGDKGEIKAIRRADRRGVFHILDMIIKIRFKNKRVG